MPLIPTLGKDRLLKTDEAVRIMKERGEDVGEVGRAVLELVKEGKVRVWLCSDGQLRYQRNPLKNLSERGGF